MTFEDRLIALEPLGFTPRQTRFIALVALHSGYCLRRQYAAFAGIRYGKNVCDFFEELVARRFAHSFCAWLPTWTVVAIGSSPTGLRACEAAFERHRQQPTATIPASKGDLAWFFARRHAVEQGDLAGLSVDAIDRYRALREAFRRPVFDELYLEWRRHGDAALTNAAAPKSPALRSVGTLLTELLPFDYSQFGSLPGVA